jgi:hypothetical protein
MTLTPLVVFPPFWSKSKNSSTSKRVVSKVEPSLIE